LLVLALGLTTGQEVIQNGGFEDSLSSWTVEYSSPYGSWEVSTGVEHQPDPDYELCVVKAYSYYARAVQTVDVPSTALLFSGEARLETTVGSASGYYAYATVTLEYKNASGIVLGRTMIIKATPNCTLETTTTCRLHVVDTTQWVGFEMLIDDELDSLPGVNRNDVACVSVVLEGWGNGRTG
jgi:hypothetical protein